MTPQQAVTETSSNATVQQQAASDLVPYRSEFDATLKVWIVYYYSPSKQKSYRCAPQADKSVQVTEVTDVSLIYQQGDTLYVGQVKVDAAAAAQTAANTASTETASPSPSPTATPAPTPTPAPTATPAPAGNTTVNVTTVQITNVYLISPGELRKRHGRRSSNPVYVVVTNNTTVFVDATTGKTVTETADPNGV